MVIRQFAMKWSSSARVENFFDKGALQLLTSRYGQICLAQVPERVSTKSFVVLIIRNSKSNPIGAQGTLKKGKLGPAHSVRILSF